jgi:molybdopterin/thiamine biosynthesis adenylyltransferase
MALYKKIKTTTRVNAQLRVTTELFERLKGVLFSRYPRKEWATFFTFGFRQAKDVLVLSMVDMIGPEEGDLNKAVPNVQFDAQYSVRAALEIEKGPLCVGVIHSHPQGYLPLPSPIDDDMDAYYADYFQGFTASACYCSVIFALDDDGNLVFSGRGQIAGKAFQITRVTVVSKNSIQSLGPVISTGKSDVTDRLEKVYGREARDRLRNSSVTIVGCGGTGSAVAHILARAGVQTFILIDYDRFEASNLERLHGSSAADARAKPKPYKVNILQDLIRSINPKAVIIPIVGNILQPLPRDYAVASDLIFCCTDTAHSRVAVSELAYRYLVPAIDIGVQLEGKEGRVNAEVGQFTLYSPDLPCAYCRQIIDPWQLSVELMSEEERRERKAEAERAAKRGDDAGSYWRDVPVIHTVGHLTTLVGALAATYGIGWITGKFRAPASFFQFNLLEENLGYVAVEMDKRPQCPCSARIGYADQGSAYAVVTAPAHWPPAKIV